MDLFREFDDDLFETKERNFHHEDTYKAVHCEPLWFVSGHSSDENDPEGNQILKYQADYYYLKNSYQLSLNAYCEYLRGMKSPSIGCLRESYENIARCFLSLGCFCHSLEYADKLHSLANFSDALSNSLVLHYDIYISCGNYSLLLNAAQNVVNLHSSSYEKWLKLAISYGLNLGIRLPTISKALKMTNIIVKECSLAKEECECKSPGNHGNSLIHKEYLCYIGACLFQSLFLVRSVQGTSLGFTVKVVNEYEQSIEQEINNLDINSSELDKIKKRHYRPIILKESSECSTFFDRGSSKYTVEDLTDDSQIITNDAFQSKWFKNY